jgi:competence protein ComEC
MLPDSTIQWTAYPALLLAGCLALGIGGAALWPGLPFWHWTGWVMAGILLALGARLYARGKLVSAAALFHTVAVAVVAIGLGGARYAYEQALPATHVAHRVYKTAEGEAPVALMGRVLDRPTDRPFGTRFRLDVERVAVAQDTTGRRRPPSPPSRRATWCWCRAGCAAFLAAAIRLTSTPLGI